MALFVMHDDKSCSVNAPQLCRLAWNITKIFILISVWYYMYVDCCRMLQYPLFVCVNVDVHG